jgi:ATP-dependent RNA helicase RhlE
VIKVRKGDVEQTRSLTPENTDLRSIINEDVLPKKKRKKKKPKKPKKKK